MIYKSKSLILLVVSALVQGGIGQKFNFPEEVQYNETYSTSPLTHWASEGSVTLTSSLNMTFKSTLVVSAVKELCTIDLTNCPPKNIPQSLQSCYCRAKTGDRYDVHVGSITSSSLAGMTLQATVPGDGSLKDLSGQAVIGRLPDNSVNRSQVTATWTIDGLAPRDLFPSQNVSVCFNTFVIVEICLGESQSEARLSIQVGETVIATKGRQCLESARHKFKAGGANVMTVTYSDPNGCSRVSQIYFDEDSQVCKPTAAHAITEGSTASVTTASTAAPTTAEIKQVAGVCPDTPRSIKSSPIGERYLVDDLSFGGQWVIFQRRVNGEVDFFRNWRNYTEGFGEVTGDFWMGLEKIHQVCNEENPCELLIRIHYAREPLDILQQADGCYYAHYSSFLLKGASDKYRLFVHGASGTAGEGLEWVNSGQFTTWDNDATQDQCAERMRDAWWFTYMDDKRSDPCGFSLNGGWGGLGTYGIMWDHKSATFTEMAFRRRTTSPSPSFQYR